MAVVWRSGSALVSISDVKLRQAQLVLEWVQVQLPVWDIYLCVTSYPGQLSLAIPSRVAAMSPNQPEGSDALQPGSKRK